MSLNTKCFEIFQQCCIAVKNKIFITKESARDKEYHFQDWFQNILQNLEINFDEVSRNTYPDFRLVDFAEGYETKGLAWPGRDANFDCNSQVPSGKHKGRTIFYVFGRYPNSEQKPLQKGYPNSKQKPVQGEYPNSEQKPLQYPLIDLIICHGDFLNADHSYVHENKSIKNFGSYGDLMIRDRKMYVAPTPFALTSGTMGRYTLIVPENLYSAPNYVTEVGKLQRVESKKSIISYKFNLKTNELTYEENKNSTHKKYNFVAYQLKNDNPISVSMDNKKIYDLEGE